MAERRVDSFFSLHESGVRGPPAPPIYVSEVKARAMNPDFNHFALGGNDAVARADAAVVKVWATPEGAAAPLLLLEADVHFPSLVRIGRALEDFPHPLPDNCLVFHMTDGVYTSFADLETVDAAVAALHRAPAPPRTASLPPRATSSFDALMQLRNLAECIDDAVETQATVAQQIEGIIRRHHAEGDPIDAARTAAESAESVQSAVGKTSRGLVHLRADKHKQEAGLMARRAALDARRQEQVTAEATLRADEDIFAGRREKHRQLQRDRAGQTRRVAQQLLDIFPIEPIAGRPLCFTVAGHFLPSAQAFEQPDRVGSTTADEEATAAALGHAGHVVALLESLLAIALPYPVAACGSSSDVFDALTPAPELGVSAHSAHRLAPGARPTRANSPFRVFPLYQRGVPPKRFKWGLYLLNKNIEELMSKHGLRVVDPRNTLANLKYLLTVLASGPGEIPKRKVGEVRALSPRVWPVVGEMMGTESLLRGFSPIGVQRS